MFNIIKNLLGVSKKYDLYYFGGRKNKNAGDIFNVDLAQYFGIKYKRSRRIEKANLICVGSNLDKLIISSKRKLLIIGAGFIFPPKNNDYINREVEILALRGELSKKRMEHLLNKSLNNCVLADPGLLASKIYPQIISKKYKVGIVPHYSEKFLLKQDKINIIDDKYKIIDIQLDVKDVVKEICECECILSSSLHGLIFADSYNIPNRQIVMSDNLAGGNYKFEDYYSAFNIELPESIDIRNCTINDELVEKIINFYTLKDIDIKQKELTEIFKSIGEYNG